MTAITFYRRSLWTPIVLPVVIAALYLTLPDGAVPDFLAPLLIALGFGGAPYAIIALVLSDWLRNKSARRARRVAFLLPAGFALAIFAVFTLLGLSAAVTSGMRATQAPKLGVVFGLYALLVGYFYAVLIEIVRFVAVKLALVDPLPSS